MYSLSEQEYEDCRSDAFYNDQYDQKQESIEELKSDLREFVSHLLEEKLVYSEELATELEWVYDLYTEEFYLDEDEVFNEFENLQRERYEP